MANILTLFLILLAGTSGVWGQATVRGIVFSKEDASPLPGVNVVEKGTRNGMATERDGTFSLRVTDPNAVLVFSFIGMISQEYPLKGQDYVLLKMKPDCIRCYFDAQRIGLYANSGVLNTPLGGQLDVTFPAVFGKGTLKSGVSFQTDLRNNKLLNAQAEFMHFALKCYFDMDVQGQYREVAFRNDLNARAYSVETHLNFSRLLRSNFYLKLIAGYSRLDFQQAEMANLQRSSGPLIGVGTWLERPLGVLVVGKAALYRDKVEYQGQISREFKRINTFIKCYKIGSFTELSLGIGTEVVYRFKRQKR